MLSFAHPLLFALLPLPMLVRWLWPPKVYQRPAVRVPFLDRVKAAKGRRSTTGSRFTTLKFLLHFLAWILLTVALARPQWIEPAIERKLPTRDLLLLVDISGSMDHVDFTNQAGVAVNRLAAVKEVVGDFLLKREGDRVGLVVFGNSPFLQVPFTTDLKLCRQLLHETDVGMAGPRTAFASGFAGPGHSVPNGGRMH